MPFEKLRAFLRSKPGQQHATASSTASFAADDADAAAMGGRGSPGAGAASTGITVPHFGSLNNDSCAAFAAPPGPSAQAHRRHDPAGNLPVVLSRPARPARRPLPGLVASPDSPWSRAWPAVDDAVRSVLAEPLARRTAGQLVALHTKVRELLLFAADTQVWAVEGVLAIPERGESPRLRNAVVLMRRVEAAFADHCDAVALEVAAARHPLSRAARCSDAFQRLGLSVRLATAFLGGLDQLSREHAAHLQSASADCVCTEQNSPYHAHRHSVAAAAARAFREGVMHHPDVAAGLEMFLADALRSLWDGERGGVPGAALARLCAACSGSGAVEWLVSVCAQEYAAHLQQFVGRLPLTHTSAELCETLSQRLRGDVVAMASWAPKAALEVMQLLAARTVAGLADRVSRDAESWLVAGDVSRLRSLYFLHAVQAAKMPDVEWLATAVRSGAARHLEREIVAATGAPLSETQAAPQLRQPQQLIDAIFDWRGHYAHLLSAAFDGQPQLVRAVEAAARAALAPCGVLLAFLVHHGMQASVPLERTLDLFRFVFPLVRDRDACLASAATHAELRLLAPGAAAEPELELVAGMRQALGSSGPELRRLEGMARDVAASRELTAPVDAAVGAAAGAVPTSLLVLAQNNWSLGGGRQLAQVLSQCLPPPFTASIGACEGAYRTLHGGRRRLEWALTRGFVTIRTRCFPKQSYELVAPLVTFLLLHSFDRAGCDTVAEAEMVGRAGGPGGAAAAALARLVKLRMLLPGEPGAAGDAAYTLNRAFTNPTKTRKINLLPRTTLPASAAAAQAKGSSGAAIKADRDILLQSAVVRAMKSHRILHHAQLVEAVAAQVCARFDPTVPAIKRAIEAMLEKDYLRRADGDAGSYEYVA